MWKYLKYNENVQLHKMNPKKLNLRKVFLLLIKKLFLKLKIKTFFKIKNKNFFEKLLVKLFAGEKYT